MTANQQALIEERKFWAEKIAHLERERDDWRDRYEAAVQAHEADVKHFNRVYAATS